MKKILLLIAVLLLAGSAAAYTVPEQYRGQDMKDNELFALANLTPNEPWAADLINDMGYKYNVRNYAQFMQRMEYQKTLPKIVRNEMVHDR